MIKKVINKIWGPQEFEDLTIPENQKVIFKLYYNSMHIGTLELNNNEWFFYYSDEFKNSKELSTIVDFPDKNKIYKTKYLWPYFMTRIPSLKQPYIKNLIIKKNIDSNNLVDLLKNFGEKTITTPFDLICS